ncbi:2-oxoglutarate dehydrogenase, E2 subunit, dihydrolipoamide succinyltransferase [Candidatus Uzinura diaspidicola str. ASNER]|uniref:Dihydrolipoamide acetyltransferase component of pyruvate dehydrogenase complex n=1 Tax=Candidatus Uzinura diaspidicola str. ASNER TaxID=1133592 RepID=L7VK07_9FLAO|nr:2-oxoglutarate dehydrogenase, E2 subunit, dihydrolipoamide succinyltransferase [Candidatus Uzinura diaspidicola str. ASNER]
MIIEMKIPSPGESIKDVEISSWLVKEGDYVEKDQPIVEIDSDKATLELTAEKNGIIKLKAKAGDTLQIGDIICMIDTSKERTKKSVIPQQHENISASKILYEKNLITNGSGLERRITNDPSSISRTSNRERLSKLRRKLSERLVSARNKTAMLTTFNELDMSSINEIRAKYKEAFQKRHGINLGIISFFTKACVQALKMYPDVNSIIDVEEKICYHFYDISIAVSSPKGLMVPVVRNADILSFIEIEKELKRLAFLARNGKITVDEITGGTFTISNGGLFGSMFSTPIINHPQSAILGLHNIVNRPVVLDRKITIRPIMYLALSYDHRIIDGRESVGFLVAVKEALENPLEILMNGEKVSDVLEL